MKTEYIILIHLINTLLSIAVTITAIIRGYKINYLVGCLIGSFTSVIGLFIYIMVLGRKYETLIQSLFNYYLQNNYAIVSEKVYPFFYNELCRNFSMEEISVLQFKQFNSLYYVCYVSTININDIKKRLSDFHNVKEFVNS